jgi:Domain of unknown function (DUF6531)
MLASANAMAAYCVENGATAECQRPKQLPSHYSQSGGINAVGCPQSLPTIWPYPYSTDFLSPGDAQAYSSMQYACTGFYCASQVVIDSAWAVFPPAASTDPSFRDKALRRNIHWDLSWIASGDNVCRVYQTSYFNEWEDNPIVCPANWTNGSVFTEPDGRYVCIRPLRERCSKTAGNPIDLSCGEKTQVETDYLGPGSFPLAFSRRYRSGMRVPYAFDQTLQSFGPDWRHDFDRRISVFQPATGATTARSLQPNGEVQSFTLAGGLYAAAGWG